MTNKKLMPLTLTLNEGMAPADLKAIARKMGPEAFRAACIEVANELASSGLKTPEARTWYALWYSLSNSPT